MKQMTLEEFAKNPRLFMGEAQRDKILVTSDGRPLVLVVGVENKDLEDLHYETSAAFWNMIAERRKEPTVPLRDVEAELFSDESAATTHGKDGEA